MKLSKLTLSFILVFLFLNGFTQTTIWSEDFTYPNGTTQGSGSPPKWTIDVSNCNFGGTGHFEVRTSRMQGRNTNGEAIWYSESISISGYTDVVISVNLTETGNMEGSDYLRVYYSLDGGAETLFETNGDNTGNFTSLVASQSGLNGSTVDIIFRTNNNAGGERHRFDNILVFEPAAGDDCNTAISIGDVTDFPFSTLYATASGQNPGCGGSDPIDIWFAYTAPGDGYATADLCGSSYDTRLAIWDACGGSVLLCNDDHDNCGNGSLQSFVSGPVSSGSTYYIQVGGYNSNVGDGDLTITFIPNPTNDDCADATAIGEVTDLPYTTIGATADGQNPGCGGIDPVDIWYEYTPSDDGSATFDLCGSNFDTRIAVWDACGGNVLDCNDDNGPACGGINASLELNVSLGTTYYVQVCGYDDNTGIGDLSISLIQLPDNDECANATAIGEVTDLPFSTILATSSGENPGCGGGAPVDLWYAYTASITGLGSFDLCGSSFNTRLAIWDACNGSVLACNNNNGPVCSGQNASIEMDVILGTTYYIQVGGANAFTGDGDLTISVTQYPSNNDCANATAIGEVTDLPFTTTNANASGEHPGCGGGSDPIDIWYAYTPSDDGLATLDLCGSSYDSRIAVWDACGGNVLGCNDDDGPACYGLNASLEVSVLQGTTYYVQVGGYDDQTGDGDLTISLIPISGNDDCANATVIGEVTDLPFSTILATVSGYAPSCGWFFEPNPVDVWFAYTPSINGIALFDLCGSNFDTRIAVWDACGGNELACNDDNGPVCSGLNSSLELDVSTGTTYYVQVGGYDDETGNGDLTITIMSDDCASAVPINEVIDLPFISTTATASGENPGCGGGDPIDIWYAYTPTMNGDATFDLCGSDFDTRIAVWDACGGNVLACNDDDGPVCSGLNSSLELNVSIGTTYYVQVGGYDDETGNGDLTISIIADDCSSAIPIGEVTDLAFTTETATASGQDPNCGGDPPVDIWFAYTPTITGDATFDLCGSSFDTRIAVWDACGGNVLACNDDDGPACSGLNASVELNVTVGTTYYVQVGGYDTDNGNGDLTIQFEISGLWTGVVDDDWNNSSNWSSGIVPDETIVVLIPGGAPNYPLLVDSLVVNAALGAYRCKSLLIQNGGLVEVDKTNDMIVMGDATVETGGTLSIGDDLRVLNGGNLYILGGDVRNNWEYNGQGDVFFGTGSAGYMSSGSLTVFNYLRFYSGSSWYATGGTLYCANSLDSVLIIVQNANVVLEDVVVENGVRAILWNTSYNPLTINGDLTLETNAHFRIEAGEECNVGGDVFLEADATGMATLLDWGTLNVTGTSTVQQYLTSERWHLVSPPISDAEIGVYMDIYLKEYNEPTDTWTYLVTPVTLPMNPTQGYSAWASDFYTGSTTVNFAGTLNDNVDYPIGSLSYTSSSPSIGWNLLGNPYPNPLQWNNLWTKTDVSEWACLHNNGNDECYNAATGTGWPLAGSMADGIIPSTQGFWVRATSASASLNIPQSERVYSTQAFYKGSDEISNTIRLRVDGNDDFDAILIQFNEDATYGFDAKFDLEKRWGYAESPNIYTIHTEDELYSVDVREKVEPNLIIPVGFETGLQSQFQIEATQYDGFTDEYKVILEDIKEGVFTELDKNVTYVFTSNMDDEKHRFNLHFQSLNAGIPEEETQEVQIYAYENDVYVLAHGERLEQVVIYDIMGHEIIRETGLSNSINKISVNSKTGYYVVRVQTPDNIITEKVFIK